MSEDEIHAVEMVREIRDAMAKKLAGKSREEVIEYYRKAGTRALEEARRQSSRSSNDST
jgi:hypothetical protein